MNKLVNKAGECVYFGSSSETKPPATSGYGLVLMNTGKIFSGSGSAWIEAPSSRLIYLPKTGVNLNSLNTDVAAWLMPAKYRIENLMCYGVTSNVGTTAKIALYSGPGATGTIFVTSVGVSTNTDDVHEFTITTAGKKYLSAPAVYLRNTVAFGSPLTASFMLVITDLS